MRGCQKKVVFLKNTGSDFFEEAYFVLRSDIPNRRYTDADIIREANRIIDENIGKRRRINIRGWLFFAVSFILGAILSAIICSLI